MKFIIGLIIWIVLGSVFGGVTIYNRLVNFKIEESTQSINSYIEQSVGGISTGSTGWKINTKAISDQIKNSFAEQKEKLEKEVKQNASDYLTEKVQSRFK